MKKSFLSFLLGVAIVASTGVFVSCQDYQDEFGDLQEQIDKGSANLNDQVAALQAEITSQIAALQSQHDKDVAALAEADKELETLLSEEIVKANAYAVAQAEKALADAKAYGDAAAAEAAAQALKDAQAYADKIAAAEAQKEAQAALLAANEQAQALFKDANEQLNKAVESLNAQLATEKSERQAADAALEAGYKAADAEIWTALNKAQKDIEVAQEAAEAAQKTADEALALAKTNEQAIAAEVERATKAEAELKAAGETEAARAKAEEAKLWEAIAEANANIVANAARIEEVYKELNQKIASAVDRIVVLENKVATLQEEMKAAQATLNEHEARLIALEAWTAAYEPVIEDLKSRMATAETQIADLYTKLAAEEAARLGADEALQQQISANATAIAQEISDRIAAIEALQTQITANKTAIAKNAADIADLQDECEFLWAALAAEESARESAIATEQSARESADTDLQDQITALQTKVNDLTADLATLSTKVENYNTALNNRIDSVENQLANAFVNPFQVISEIDFQGATAPSYTFKYYPAFDVIVAGKQFTEANRVVAGSYKQEAGKVFVLVCPQGNDFTGHQIYVRDEKNVDYPGYTFGTLTKAVYADDLYFNTDSMYTRGATSSENKGAIWMADVLGKDVKDAELLASIGASGTSTLVASQAYSVIGEYFQLDADLNSVQMLTWDENFDFRIDIPTYSSKEADKLAKSGKFDANADKYDVSLDFTNADDTLIYKQTIICDSAHDECGATDDFAANYMNELAKDKFNEWVESGKLDDFTVTVDDSLANHTFYFTWYVVGKSGETFTYTDNVTIVPEFEAAKEATFNFEVTPTSAALQTTTDLTKSVEGLEFKDLVWSKFIPDCQTVEVTLAPVKAAPADGIVLHLKDVKDYNAPQAAESATCTKAETDLVKSLGISYDPSKLVVDEPYQYTVTVKYGKQEISTSTINIVMRRPDGHDIELTQITSAWNQAKTKTIVWAQKGAQNGEYYNAWYKFEGSYTDILNYTGIADTDSCTLVFSDKTQYTDATYTVVTMPDTANTFQIDVPSVAVKHNTGYETLSFSALEKTGWFYNLAYGTNVFGLENLYGGEHALDVAFCSPIYYDGVTYNWNKQQYEGGCSLKSEPYFIEFPNEETLISSGDFEGSNDPSTSIYDPIVYFGATRDERIDTIMIALATDEDLEALKAEQPKYAEFPYVWNDPTNEYLFAVKPEVQVDGIYFKTYDNTPSLQSIPAFYYNLIVVDVWGCEKKYPFIISVNPNTPMN